MREESVALIAHKLTLPSLPRGYFETKYFDGFLLQF